MSNNFPFKVVCIREPKMPIKNIEPSIVRIGEIYTAINISYDINRWEYSFFELAEHIGYSYATSLFVLVKDTYEDATSEVLEKFKSPNETPDKIIIPEKQTTN